MDHLELKKLRDRVVVYIAKHGRANPGCSVDANEIMTKLGLTEQDLHAVVITLINDNMLPHNGIVGTIGLNSTGLALAGRLESELNWDPPRKPATDVTTQHIHIGRAENIVIGRDNLNQQVSTFQSGHDLSIILGEIESALPSLGLQPTDRQDAAVKIETIREELEGKRRPDRIGAFVRSLADILTKIGTSAVGGVLAHRLIQALG